MIARLNILALNTGDVGHDIWVDYDHYQNTGDPDVFAQEDLDEIVANLDELSLLWMIIRISSIMF